MENKDLIAAILAAGIVTASGKVDTQYALEQFGEMKKLLSNDGLSDSAASKELEF